MALTVLGSSTADELRRIIVTEDVDALTLVPGIGKRTAQKLILDLRPKLAEGDADLVGSSSSPSRVREALESLGFGSAEIADVLPLGRRLCTGRGTGADRPTDAGESLRCARRDCSPGRRSARCRG